MIIGLIYVVALWRYQSLIPLMYVFFVFEYVMRLIAPAYSPGLETPPGEIGTLIFIPLGLVMLVLSLRDD